MKPFVNALERGEKEIERLHRAISKAHLVLTKSSLTADERVFVATGILARALTSEQEEKHGS